MSTTTVYAPSTLPYLTAEHPGTGGVLKRFNEDFAVDEQPLYPAIGAGTHVFFQIEKQGMTTLDAIRRIARALGRQPRDVGYAGMKDAHGVTRQWMSLEHIETERITGIDLKGLKVLTTTRHSNKIKLGHLSGNRFVIKIRGAAADGRARATVMLDVLRRRGVPNYFGPQRFGARGDNALIGLAVVREDFAEAIALMLGRPGPVDHGAVRTARELFDANQLEASAAAWPGAFRQQARVCEALARNGDPRRAWRAVDHTLRKLYISALQSDMFNRVVARRVDRLDQIETGDVAWKHANGACFRVEDATVEQPRCEAFEISPTGPLFGKRMTEPTGLPGKNEARVLSEAGLTREQMVVQDGVKLDGARRPLRVPLGECDVTDGDDDRGPYLQLRFGLPPGSYATSVVREVCKVDVEADE